MNSQIRTLSIYVILAACLAIISQHNSLIDNSAESVSIGEIKQVKKSKIKKASAPISAGKVRIIKRWQLPEILREVSAIVYLDKERFACIMDEKGTIYIFNTSLNAIEKEIPFTGNGDFEGLAINGKTAYALKSDGRLFIISDYNGKPSVKEIETMFSTKENMESLCYDHINNRLLLVPKSKNLRSPDYKGIYAFDLKSNELVTTPVIKIYLGDKILKKNKRKSSITPSDMAIHPKTGEFYIVEGSNPKIVVIGPDGNLKKLYSLNKKDFPLAEGITFSPSGELFISSEGGDKGNGTITQLELE